MEKIYSFIPVGIVLLGTIVFFINTIIANQKTLKAIKVKNHKPGIRR